MARMGSLVIAYKALTDSHSRQTRQGGNRKPAIYMGKPLGSLMATGLQTPLIMATAKDWSCSRCGYSDDHDHPPQHCPSCGTSRLYFLAVRPVQLPPTTRRPSRWSLLEID